MNYTEFLSTLQNGFNMILNNLPVVITSLLSNYFFITLLGITIFTTFLPFIIDSILSLTDKDLDNVNGGDIK